MFKLLLPGLLLSCLLPGVSQARTVQALSIDPATSAPPASQGSAEPSPCTQFQPTRQQLIDYFEHARALDEWPRYPTYAVVEYYPTLCTVTGELTLDNDLEGRFSVSSTGVAELNVAPNQIYHFYLGEPAWRSPLTRWVKTLKVLALNQGTADPDACQAFSPTPAQLIYYFNHALPIDSAEPSPEFYAHDFYYTPCHIDGEVLFNDGQQAGFRVFSAGTSYLSTDTKHTYLYFADNPWTDPYDFNYGYGP